MKTSNRQYPHGSRAGFFFLPCKKCDEKDECIHSEGCVRRYSTMWQDCKDWVLENPLKTSAMFSALTGLAALDYLLFTSFSVAFAVFITCLIFAVSFWLVSLAQDE